MEQPRLATQTLRGLGMSGALGEACEAFRPLAGTLEQVVPHLRDQQGHRHPWRHSASPHSSISHWGHLASVRGAETGLPCRSSAAARPCPLTAHSNSGGTPTRSPRCSRHHSSHWRWGHGPELAPGARCPRETRGRLRGSAQRRVPTHLARRPLPHTSASQATHGRRASRPGPQDRCGAGSSHQCCTLHSSMREAPLRHEATTRAELRRR